MVEKINEIVSLINGMIIDEQEENLEEEKREQERVDNVEREAKRIAAEKELGKELGTAAAGNVAA
jgi:hypothetical protein